jgi:glycosyltransferase involved in cell wall biosynthesis
MKKTDSITVLICVHSSDREHDSLLKNAFESLVRQTYQNFDVLVVMDECWYQTKYIVESFLDRLKIKIYERPKKEGLSFAKNFGIELCQSDWIAYLDADDEWVDCKLEVQRNFMLENPDIDFCFTNAWDKINGKIYPNCFKIGQYDSNDQIYQRLLYENCLCHGSAIIRTDILKRLKYINAKGIEDWNLWVRAMGFGYKFAKVPERLYIYSLGTSVPR